MALAKVSTPSLAMSCSGLQAPHIPEAEVLWITSNPVQNFEYPAVVDVSGQTPPSLAGDIPPLTFCNVSIALAHPGENDTSFISVWLPPTEQWNHRYTATGGGGIAAGYDFNMVSPLASGFAASSTDGGLTLNHTVNPQTGLWGVNDDGSLDEGRLTNLGWRSIHDMSLASKDLIRQFYDQDPNYSYWAGCSQGGRQGYAAAAKYPHDFDGILAIAPALGIEYVGPAAFWPVVVMHNEGEFVPSCVLEKFQAALVDTCDPLDGATDGLISDYDLLTTCSGSFNASALIGQSVSCPQTGTNSSITITPRHAKIVTKILDGPRDASGTQYWFGTAPGANFSGVAGTVYENGRWIPKPFAPAAGWLKNVVSPLTRAADITAMSYDEYFAAFNKSVELASPFLGEEYLGLEAFRTAGGKLLTWVGLADQYIPPSHALQFHDRVSGEIGGDSGVDDFYRLFTAPGVGHCAGGNGPQPLGAMAALVQWVENGIAPRVLHAKGEDEVGREMERELCLYPKKLVYRQGDVTRMASFGCEEPERRNAKSCVFALIEV
ncbi:Tannase/feruloyl esterase [Aspergillus aurantiobrunneus]